MGHSQAAKAANRERILAEAAGQAREDGLQSLSVGQLMRSAGLTHGGFYRHFGSRSELIAEALERALADGEARAKASGGSRNFEARVKSYLSRSHRDQPAAGCAIAALAGDVAREDAPAREVMSRHIESFVEAMAASLGEGGESDAILAVSAMVGALAISRVLPDQKRSDEVLKTVRDRLIELGRRSA